MHLTKTYSIDIPRVHFKFTPYHKFNFIIANSGVGKTYLLNQIGANAFKTDMRVLAHTGDLNLITKENDYLILFDEFDFYNYIKKNSFELLQNSPNVFLIIARELIDIGSTDYRAIYDLVSEGKYYSVKRKYKDYTSFIPNFKYFTEDSNSGYKYFKELLGNTVSVYGKKNFRELKNIKATVIADGSAFGYELQRLLKSKKYKLDYFLPDSFEGLVLEHTKSAENVVLGAHTDVVLKYKSIEAYYTDKIKDFYPGYTKTNGHPKIYGMNLIDLDIHKKREAKVKDYQYKTAISCPEYYISAMDLQSNIEKQYCVECILNNIEPIEEDVEFFK